MLDNTQRKIADNVVHQRVNSPDEEGGVPSGVGILKRAQMLSSAFERKMGNFANPLGVVIDELISPVEAMIGGRRTTMFGTNSYLGLNFHPDCVNASIETIKKFGTGSTASRVASGNQDLHLQLENEISDMFGGKQAVIFSTGFMANLGVISALAKENCAIFLDSHCHASIFDAAKLSGAEIVVFEHNDAADLDRLFRRSRIPADRCLVVVEGLYSVWGDVGDLKPLVAVTKQHGGVIVVDEAHSFGLYGENGRGLCEQLGIEDDVDVVVGTFSKSVGVVGGFCVTGNPALRALRFLSRPYLYTASLPPAVVASARQAIRLIRTDHKRRQQVWDNAKIIHDGLTKLGFTLCADTCPVGAIKMPNFKVGIAMWQTLLENGVYVNILMPPGTPTNEVVLRFSVSAAHTPELIEKSFAVFAKVGRELGLIP